MNGDTLTTAAWPREGIFAKDFTSMVAAEQRQTAYTDTPETSALEVLTLGKTWKVSYEEMRALSKKLERELAPFRGKRGIGGYIDDMRRERNTAQAQVAMLFAALEACDGKLVCSLAREGLELALQDMRDAP